MEQTEVLSLGLGFVPKQNFDLFNTVKSVNRFVRGLTVKRHFLDQDAEDVPTSSQQPSDDTINIYKDLQFNDQLTLKNLTELQSSNISSDLNVNMSLNFNVSNPEFYPVQSRTEIMDKCQFYIERDLRKLSDETGSKKFHSNLSPVRLRALNELRKMDDVLVKMSDKGGTVVVLNKDDYRASLEVMLQDTSTYKKLAGNPTMLFQNRLKIIIEEGVSLGVLTRRQADYIYVENPIVPILHSLPKVHKQIRPPPMRPIVSGIGSVNERLCEWLDSLLKPLVRIMPGFIQDSRDVLNAFDSKLWKQEYTWITYDVESLYTAIPHSIALWALEYHFSSNSNFTLDLRNYALQVTDFLMKHNYFFFNSQFFLQVRGVSMGAKYSPSLAN